MQWCANHEHQGKTGSPVKKELATAIPIASVRVSSLRTRAIKKKKHFIQSRRRRQRHRRITCIISRFCSYFDASANTNPPSQARYVLFIWRAAINTKMKEPFVHTISCCTHGYYCADYIPNISQNTREYWLQCRYTIRTIYVPPGTHKYYDFFVRRVLHINVSLIFFCCCRFKSVFPTTKKLRPTPAPHNGFKEEKKTKKKKNWVSVQISCFIFFQNIFTMAFLACRSCLRMRIRSL